MLDLLLVNGRLEDPFAALSGEFSIGVEDGRIAGVFARGTALPKSKERLDIKGYCVSPGWIDLHTHVYPDKTSLGIEADQVGVRQGVTTVLDAGSAGCDSFAHFSENVIKRSNTRVLAWLNIARAGLCGDLSELADADAVDAERTVRLIESTPSIRGIKVRMSSSVLGGRGTVPLRQAREVSRRVGLPLMVHIGNGPPALSEIFDLLEHGDIVTHAFHGKPGGCFEESGAPLAAMLKARARGVYLDIGHGTSSFAFAQLERALASGIWPDSISTDIYCTNYGGPVFSLAKTMEKCLALGMPLAAALACVTIRPAVLLGLPELGAVRVGSPADLTIFRLDEKAVSFVDAEGTRRNGAQSIVVWGAVKAGKVWRSDE